MKRLALILSLLLLSVPSLAGEIVRLPLKGNLVDSKGGLTAGECGRVSGRTCVETSGILTTKHGNRENLLTDPTAFDQWTVRGTATVTVNTTEVTDPFGGNLAEKVVNLGVILNDIYQGTSGNTADASIIPSIYVRLVEGGTCTATNLRIYSSISGEYGRYIYPISSLSSSAWTRISRNTPTNIVNEFTNNSSGNSGMHLYVDTGTCDVYFSHAQLEELPSGNTIGSDLFDQEETTSVTSGSDTVTGNIYRIVSRSTLDFTTVGAPSNDTGTYFIATSADTLGSGDELAQIDAPAKGIPYDANTSGQAWPGLAGSEEASGNPTDNTFYRIMARDDADFTTIGAPDNDVGTYFYSDGTGVTLDSGDKLRPVQVSWIPYSTNTIEIDETEEAVKVTYGSTDQGASLALADAADLSSNLTAGQWYQVDFQGKYANGAVDVEIAQSDDTELASATLTTSWADYSLVFKCTNVATDKIQFDNMAATEVAYIRNLSIKEIPPLALLEPSDFATGTIPAQPCFEAEGLSINGEGVNLLDYSEDFSEWTASNVTPVANLTGPDGETNSAYTLTATDANGTLKYTVSSPLGGTADTFAIWMKRVTGTGNIDLTDDDGSTWTTKTLTTSWQRFSVSGTETNPVVGIRIVTDTDAIGIFGADLREAPYIDSYIPTDGSPAWRTTEAGNASDDTGYRWTMGSAVKAALSDAVGGATSEGTFIFDLIPLFDEADVSAAGGILSVTNSDAGILKMNGAGNMYSSDATNSVTESPTVLANGSELVYSIRWSKSSNALSVSNNDGDWEHSSDSYDGSFPLGNELWLAYGNEYPFHIKNVYIYDEYQADTWLEESGWLTSGCGVVSDIVWDPTALCGGILRELAN